MVLVLVHTVVYFNGKLVHLTDVSSRGYCEKNRRTIKATVLLIKLKPKRMKLELDDGRFDSIAFFFGLFVRESSPS